jgi:hypothetical protein
LVDTEHVVETVRTADMEDMAGSVAFAVAGAGGVLIGLLRGRLGSGGASPRG